MPDSASLAVGIAVGATVGSSVGRTFGAIERQSQRAKLGLGRAVRESASLKRELADLRGEQVRGSGASAELARDIGRVGRELDRAERRAKGYRLELRRVDRLQQAAAARSRAVRLGGAALAAGGYAIGRLVGGSLDAERSAVQLGTVLAGSEQLGLARTRAREDVRAGRSLHDETELLELQYQLKGADLSAEEARIGSTIASQVATATRGATTDVGSVLGTAMLNFGRQFEGTTEERMTAIGDVLTATQQQFKFDSFDALGAGLRSASSAANDARLSFQQTAGILGVLNSAGVESERAGTALTAMLRERTRASQELGFTVVRDAAGMLDAVATIESIHASVAHLDTDARDAALQEAFGDEGKVAISPLLRKFKEGGLDEALSGDVGGKTAETFQQFLDSGPGQVDRLTTNVKLLGAVLGDTFRGVGVGRLTGWLADGVAWTSRLIEHSAAARWTIVGLTGAVGSFIGAVVAVRTIKWLSLWGVGGVRDLAVAYRWARLRAVGLRRSMLATKAVALGSTLAGWARGGLALLGRGLALAAVKAWALAAALLANPITWIGIAIAGAALVVYKYWEPLSGFFKGLWKGVVSGFKSAWTGLTDIFRPIIDSWAAVFTDFSWAKVGSAIMKTLASGIIWPGPVGLALKGAFGKIREWLPFSDARSGPLSDLTASGASILDTLGAGVGRAGPAGLRRPLASQLAAATTGLTLAVATPAAPAAAAPTPFAATSGAAPAPSVHNDYRTYNITLQQQPGEDAEALADRLLREIERREQLRGRTAFYDAP